MQCQVNNCLREATFAPVVLIPAKNIPEELTPPAEIVIPIAMCKRCASRTRVADYLDESLKQQILLANPRKAEMNFNKARIDKIKFAPKKLEAIAKGGNYAII